VRPLRIALAQLAPRLGVVDENLRLHRQLLTEARAGGAELCVFPELGLTGYLLQDLNAEVAMRPDDARLLALASETAGMSAVVGFVEESDDHRLFISAALLEDGAVRHIHRKVFLPTYGLFDERRFFAAGSVIRATPSRLGVPVGLAICEDFWHLSVPELLALDGAQLLINVSSSPGRDVAAVNEVGLGTASSWWTLMRAYAQLTTTFVVYVNRVGVDESITFWGGSEVVGPAGDEIFRAPLHDEGLYFVDVDLDDIRRERISLPLLRDERPEVILRQLERIIRERSGEESADLPDSAAPASSSNASDGRRPLRRAEGTETKLDVSGERR
jgi:predicted amidohydrolase